MFYDIGYIKLVIFSIYKTLQNNKKQFLNNNNIVSGKCTPLDHKISVQWRHLMVGLYMIVKYILHARCLPCLSSRNISCYNLPYSIISTRLL